MPTLDWMGKEKVITHYRSVPYRTMVRVPEKGVLDSRGTDCGNMVIHGDNLAALKALLPEFEGKVDCIYIDPPYNTGEEKWVYNDNVNDPRILKWLGQVVGKEGEDFTRHDKWLCMMYPRLQLLKKMLSRDGVIFISIDDNECASLKCICDEIFGSSCFQGDISWQRTYSPRNDKHGLTVEVEHILVYSIRPTWQPRTLNRTTEMDSRYSSPDGDPEPWKSADASAPDAHQHTGMVYAIQHPFTGELFYPPEGRHWNNEQPKMLEIMSEWAPYCLADIGDYETRAALCGIGIDDAHDGVKAIVLDCSPEEAALSARNRYDQMCWPELYFTLNGYGGLSRKTYLSSKGGKLPSNLWVYDEVGHTDEASKELKALFGGKAVFQNPKPTRLIRRILEVACPPNGIVLDAFAGSGTTGQAVLMENQIKHANRRFILIDMGDYADTTTAQRIRTTISGYRITKKHEERLYEKKLTATNLKKAATFYEEALAAREAADDGRYDKVDGPKMDGSSIVVNGITNKGHDVPGIDSGFSFFELGPTLFDEKGMLNADVSVEDVRRYVWFTETKTAYSDRSNEHPYLLGEVDDTVYYLAYNPDDETVLAAELLRGLPIRGATTVVFADRCLLADETLEALGIRYRQIPRQIARM